MPPPLFVRALVGQDNPARARWGVLMANTGVWLIVANAAVGIATAFG